MRIFTGVCFVWFCSMFPVNRKLDILSLSLCQSLNQHVENLNLDTLVNVLMYRWERPEERMAIAPNDIFYTVLMSSAA